MIALVLTTVVMSGVFGLLYRGQESFRREPEVSEVNSNARSGLDMIARDLVLAGRRSPPAMAVLWSDGGGNNPDGITVLYADANVPTSRPLQCGGGGGPCNTISMSSTVNIDPSTFDPPSADPASAYADGMVLFALETSDCNGDGQLGIYPFEVTQPPQCTGAGGGGGGPGSCTTLNINHNPGNGVTGLNEPNGFNDQIRSDCAVIGFFHAVQYRVNPPPPTDSPSLERRDLSLAEPWIPVSRNIENLQFEYGLGSAGASVAMPATPNPADPETWVTRVKVTTFGRSQSTNLQGASAGVYSAADTFVRQTFSTLVSLRNVSAASVATGTGYN